MKIVQSIPVDTSKFKNGITEDVREQIVALKNYLRENPAALYATPQLLDIETPLQIIVLRMKKKKSEVLMTMINSIILGVKNPIACEELQEGIEGTYLNIRHAALSIAYNALPEVKPIEVTLSGKSALVFQQALRLTQGITIDTLGLRVDNFKEYTEADDLGKQEIVTEYIKVLKEIQEAAMKDEDVGEYIKATEFTARHIERSIDSEFKEQLQSAYDEVKEAEKVVGERVSGDTLNQ